MKYYTNSEAIPAAAITYAGMDNAIQPILFTTQYGHVDSYEYEGEEAAMKGRPLCWTIRSIKVTLVRDWNTATANIVLTTSIPNSADKIPPLPNLQPIRGGNYPYLTYEDEIRIYAGWIDSPSTPICADMLDQYPIDLYPSEGANLFLPMADISNFKTDISKPLAPIFWGFIDSINIVADRGVQCIIQCRDRARVFSDTKIISLPSLQGSQLIDTSQNREGGLANGNRGDILVQVARAATGALLTGAEENTNSCWKEVKAEPIDGAQSFSGYEGNPNTRLDRREPPEDPASWVRGAMFKMMHPTSSPRFHRWVQRPPLVKGNGAAVFQILNRTPIEVVRFLADTEERPTDFYASHVNGDFIFGPRVLDTSGFYDPNRMYRTYFFKTYPKEMADHPPLPNQMILGMRVTSSSLSTYNRFVIVDSETSGTYGDFMENIQMAMEIQNWSLQGRRIAPPCRNHIIYDGSLTSYENPSGAALLIGLSQGRTWSRELSAIQMTLVGDPTLYPNEAVRVYNSVLHDFATSVNPGTPQSIEMLEEQQAGWERLVSKDREQEFKSAGSNLKSFTNNSLAEREVGRLEIGRLKTDGYILPVYKIRSVQHNLSTQGEDIGYTTKVEMIADY